MRPPRIRRTGIPISTHTHPLTKRGADQQRIFREEGVQLDKVVIGHSGDTTDVEHLVELAAADREVGVAEAGVGRTQHLGDPVGPAAHAVRASRVGVADALGEGVTQGDETVEGRCRRAHAPILDGASPTPQVR